MIRSFSGYCWLSCEIGYGYELTTDNDDGNTSPFEPEPDNVPLTSSQSMPTRKKPKINNPSMFRMKSAYKWDSDHVDQQKKELSMDQRAHLEVELLNKTKSFNTKLVWNEVSEFCGGLIS